MPHHHSLNVLSPWIFAVLVALCGCGAGVGTVETVADTSTTESDPSSDPNTSADPGTGSSPNPSCAPTTCTVEQKDCGSISDGCQGLLDCGSCSGGESCGGGGIDNVCGIGSTCVSESDAVFCSRLSKECNSVTASDNCGEARTISCGTCSGTETCSANNVCSAPAAATCVSTLAGTITDMTLTEAASPYCVTSDLLVPVGSRLTIEPGVTLDFQGHYKLTIKGHLTAVGTADKRITFTSSKNANWPATSGEDRGWNGLRFYPYMEPSEIGDDYLEYCNFSWANKGGNIDSDPYGTYIDTTGGAVYLAGRPSSMTGPLDAVVPRFHFNHNILEHNAAHKSGGGFHVIQEICMSGIDSCFDDNPPGTRGYFKVVFDDNHFESNRCNLEQYSYGAGAWSQFHCGLTGFTSITIKGGAFVNNGCEQGSGTSAETQVGGADGEITLQDVSISPLPSQWLWNYNLTFHLLGTTPASN